MPPSRRTDDVAARLVEALEAGTSYRHAAAYAGIAESTLMGWLADARAAQAAQQQRPLTPSETATLDFMAPIMTAADRGLATVAVELRRASRDDPRLLLKILERRAPKEWSPVRRVAVAETTGAGPAFADLLAWDDDDPNPWPAPRTPGHDTPSGHGGPAPDPDLDDGDDDA